MANTITSVRVLLVCANPRGTDPIRTAEEDRTLRESVQLSPYRDRVTIETLHAATIDDLRRSLLRQRFDIVHFSGHGTHTGLAFEGPGGRLMVPSSEGIAEMLKRHTPGSCPRVRPLATRSVGSPRQPRRGRVQTWGERHTGAAKRTTEYPATFC